MAALLLENPSGGRIIYSSAPVQVTSSVRNIPEILKKLCFLRPILRHIRWKHFCFDEEALSGIRRSLNLDHVVWPDSPSLLQILKFVARLS
jgi:hypothetical protein